MKKQKTIELPVLNGADIVLSYPVISSINDDLIKIGKRFKAIKDNDEFAKKVISLGFLEIDKKSIDKIKRYSGQEIVENVDYHIPPIMAARITRFIDNLDLFDGVSLFVGRNQYSYNGSFQCFRIGEYNYEIKDNEIKSNFNLMSDDPLLVGTIGEGEEGNKRYFYIAHWGTDIPNEFMDIINKDNK